MNTHAFHQVAAAKWTAAISQVLENSPPDRSIWSDLHEIHQVLNFFAAATNHMHLPGGGGFDLVSVRPSREPGCLELLIGRSSAIVVKPSSLSLDYIKASPVDSFLMVECDSLVPTGTHNVPSDQHLEEVVDANDDYWDRSGFDDGILERDADGTDVPLPPDARIVMRVLRGRIMLVCKGSLYNGDPKLYRGQHNHLGVTGVRNLIERSLGIKASNI